MGLSILVAERADTAELLARGLKAKGADVTVVSTLESAVEALLTSHGFDLVLCSTVLDDGCGLEIAKLATLMLPTPRVIGLADAALGVIDAHSLGAAGVQALLLKPVSADAVLEALHRLDRDTPPPVYALLARYVGRVSLLSFEREVRRSLLLQAIERANGSRSGAARLLKTSRQMVQKVVNGEDE